MADRDFQERILKFLNSKTKKKEVAARIIQALRVPKKSFNNQIYRLQREGRVVKYEESPPVWGLPSGSGAVASFPVAIRRSKRFSGDSNKTEKRDNADLRCRILDYLKVKCKACKSLEIAKGTGYSRAVDVNAILYSMLKDGLITKISEKPPMWGLATEVSPQYSQDVAAIKFDASAENNSLDNSISGGQGIPVFQDQELFKTEPQFGSETPEVYSCLKKENEVACSASESEQGQSVGFSPIDDDMDVSTQGSYKLFQRFGDKSISEGTSSYDDGIEDDTIECDGDTFDRQEQDSEHNMDMLSSGRKLVNIKEENCDKMIGCATSSETNEANDIVHVKKHAWDEIQKHVGESPDNYHDYDIVKKPKTFRDFFKLDDPTSDDTSSSFDSGREIETDQSIENDSTTCQSADSLTFCKNEANNLFGNTENQCIPDLSVMSSVTNTPELTNVQSVFSTPQILDQVLDMSDSSVISATREDQKSPEEAYTEHELEAKDEIGQVDMEEGTSGDIMDIDNEMTGEVQHGKKSSDFNMEDCDKVLKVLLELKAIAQFVLKRKTDIPPEHLDEVLQKCLSMNYVSGSSKLWKITDEGVAYMSKKTGESDNKDKHDQNIQVEKKVKPTFKGPPPSPMALLNKGPSLGGNKVAENDPSQNVRPLSKAFTSHSPNSLFKPPPVRKSNLSSHTAISENSGPQSLMSIQFDSNPSNRSEQRNWSSQESISHDKPQPLMSLQLGSNSINKSQMLPSQDQKRDLISSMVTSEQKLELNSNLWGTKSTANSSNMNNIDPKLQSLSQAASIREHLSRSAQSSSTRQVPKNMFSQQVPFSQNAKTTTDTQEVGKLVIPDKYADYPNQSTSMQSLKSKTQSTHSDRSGGSNQSKSAFNKGPPPSPLDILAKGMKKTEISPPSSYKDSSFGQTTSPNHLIGKNMECSVNRSSIKHSGSLFGNENKQTVLQKSGQLMMQSSPRSLSSIPIGKGPPAPPAVKLGLQVAQSTPTPISMQAQNKPKPNLGLVLNTESFNALNKNPVSALMEYAQSRKMVATVEVLNRKGSSHKPTFEMAAFVGKRKFPSVSCTNKKEGRKEACDIALRQLVAEGQFQAENASSSTSSIPPVPSANMTHFDTVAALTHRGFTALVSQITTESFAGRKVIAGLVMKRSADDVGVLISLGTGNRCITGQQLSLQGNTVNDSHAEIITRRGFMRFLYKRLLEFDPNKPHPMFEKSPRGKLQIRPNISFHLYISTAPCGDGALFSPRDAESSKAPLDSRIRPPHEPTFSSNVQGLLRTKVEGGEGTIPVEPGFKVQTFDGIQRGERLRTMSCTDKVCRWNVVGMQGALLNHFLEPIYLDSLTLGLLYDHGHLCRAVCCRVGRGSQDVNSELPPGFKLNHPWLGRVTVCDPPREVQKTKALSINWCFGDNAPEVTDGTQGLCYTSIEKGFFSRCTKHNLFTSFKSLCEKFGRQDLLSVSSYNEAKMAAQDFVSAKQTMLRRFKENGFGKWVSKPVEEEMFGYDEKK